MFFDKKEMLILIIGSILIYLLLVAGLYLFQRKMIYYTVPGHQSRADYNAQDMDVVTINTRDGLALQAWYKAPQGDKPVIVVFHGNASHMGMSAWKVRPYLDEGYGALLPAYRGYAGNPGKPTEQGLYKDAEASIDFLEQEKAIAENRIVLLGESLGTGVAIEMASKEHRDVEGVILESPYTSFVDLAKRQYFFIPFVGLLTRDKYDSIDKIKNVKAPLLVVHGKLDMIVPFKFGKRIFESANQPKEMVEIPTAGHNNLYVFGAAQRVLHFLSGLPKK